MLPADSPFAPLPAPGPHPATAELRAYAAGTLPAAEQHRIEAHMLDCERCTELADGFLMSDAATTDQAVAALRTRLQARLGRAEPLPGAGGWAWPRLAAAAALVGVVAGGLWTLEHRQAPTSVSSARLATTQPPQPAAQVAATPAAASDATMPNAPAGISEPLKTADYAAVAAARPARAARAHRRHPTTSRPAGRQIARVAVPRPPAAASAKPTDALATTDTADQPSDQLAQAAVLAPPSAPATKAVSAEQPERKAPTDTFTAFSQGVAANSLGKAKALAANNAATVRVANTAMPVAPTINPAPVGGPSALREYLHRAAAEFTPESNVPSLSGTVRVKFVVGADGKVSNLKIVRGLRADYDSEALRIVCDGPAWQPGVAGGRRAPLPMEVAVPF